MKLEKRVVSCDVNTQSSTSDDPATRVPSRPRTGEEKVGSIGDFGRENTKVGAGRAGLTTFFFFSIF